VAFQPDSKLVARAELRNALRRLIAATQRHEADVTVSRRDLEVLVVVASTKLGVQPPGPMPNMHPEQR